MDSKHEVVLIEDDTTRSHIQQIKEVLSDSPHIEKVSVVVDVDKHTRDKAKTVLVGTIGHVSHRSSLSIAALAMAVALIDTKDVLPTEVDYPKPRDAYAQPEFGRYRSGYAKKLTERLKQKRMQRK